MISGHSSWRACNFLHELCTYPYIKAELVKELLALGMPAERAGSGPPPGNGDVLIKGAFVSINKDLSQRRAETVRDFLTGRGIAAERLTTEWKGETQPVASNSTKEGQAKNRRTEITLNPMPVIR